MDKIIILGCGYLGANLANYFHQNFNDIIVYGLKNYYSMNINSSIKFINKTTDKLDLNDMKDFKNAIVIDATGIMNATNRIDNSTDILFDFLSKKVDFIKKVNSIGITKYIFLSSGGTVYSDSNKKHKEDEAVCPNNIYALEKIFIENFLRIYHIENPKFNYLILRLSNPYGGMISCDKRQGIIDVALLKFQQNETLELYGNMDNIRDYIYIDDLCESISNIIKLDICNDVVNIGSGKGHSIREIINIIEKKLNAKIKIEYKIVDSCNISSNILNIDKMNSLIGNHLNHSIEDGIELCIKRILE